MLGGRRDARSAGAGALDARSALGVAADAEWDTAAWSRSVGLVTSSAGHVGVEEGLVAYTERREVPP